MLLELDIILLEVFMASSNLLGKSPSLFLISDSGDTVFSSLKFYLETLKAFHCSKDVSPFYLQMAVIKDLIK